MDQPKHTGGRPALYDAYNEYALRVPLDVWERFAQLAKDEHRSINAQIVVAMKQALERAEAEASA